MHDATDELDDDQDEKFEETFSKKKDQTHDKQVLIFSFDHMLIYCYGKFTGFFRESPVFYCD